MLFFLFGKDYGIFYFFKQSVMNGNSFLFFSYKFSTNIIFLLLPTILNSTVFIFKDNM